MFLARKRQLAHLRSENRLCAVLAKPGEAASCGHWQNCKSQKAWREHKGPRRIGVRALARMADVWPVLRLRVQDSIKRECETKFWWQSLGLAAWGLEKTESRQQKKPPLEKKRSERSKFSPSRERYVPIQLLRAKAGPTGPQPELGQGQMEARLQDCRSKGKGSSYGERERGTSDQVPCLIAP